MSIPIKIITLYPESDHIQELISTLSSQGIDASIYLGVDGRKSMPNLLNGENLDQANALRMRQVQLTSSEVGCYLSHFRVIKEAYEAGLSQLCIFEDDVKIKDSFSQVLEEISQLPETFEFIRLFGMKIQKRKVVQPLDSDHVITRPLRGLVGTMAYVINRSGMKKVIKQGARIYEPIDKFYDHYWNTDLQCYALEPHAVIGEVGRPGASSIQKTNYRSDGNQLIKFFRKHQLKLLIGSKKRIYYFKNWTDFRPATKPEKT